MNNQGISLGLQAGVLLEKYGFHFSHSLGQNFLLDESFVRRLAACAAIVPGERVLEIGPGAGVMTRCLLEEGARVTAVELDQSLRPVLDEMLAGQKDARVVYADALKLDPGELFGAEAYRVVANLPYYITSDMILHLLRAQNKPSSITALVQKEAAERISAPMGGKNWCALSATVRYFGSCEAHPAVRAEAGSGEERGPAACPDPGRLFHAPQDPCKQPVRLVRHVPRARAVPAGGVRSGSEGARRGGSARGTVRAERPDGLRGGRIAFPPRGHADGMEVFLCP